MTTLVNELKRQPDVIRMMMGISWRFPFHFMKQLNTERYAGEFVVYYPGDFWVRYYSKERRYMGAIHGCHFSTCDTNDILFMLEHEGNILIYGPDNLNELRKLVDNKEY